MWIEQVMGGDGTTWIRSDGGEIFFIFFPKRLFEEKGRGFEDEKSDDEVGRCVVTRMGMGN